MVQIEHSEGTGYRLARATLSTPERRAVDHLIARLREELGDDLRAIWLYGSRARGEAPHAESDVDLMAIAGRGGDCHRAMANDLRFEVGRAEGVEPFLLSLKVNDVNWLNQRRQIEDFFVGEVDRDKIVLYGSALD